MLNPEVYGDPKVHPQSEQYWGNVNPIGPRSCYDEGKRAAESLTYAYAQQGDVDVRVVRIFNTFGPRMNRNDGRVVSNFIVQALRGADIQLYGDGSQTRSFMYIHDLVDGLLQAMESDYHLPINLGNPNEISIADFAVLVKGWTNSTSQIVWLPPTQDDPKHRRPDISLAAKELGWVPKFALEQGILETIQYFRQQLLADGLLTNSQ